MYKKSVTNVPKIIYKVLVLFLFYSFEIFSR